LPAAVKLLPSPRFGIRLEPRWQRPALEPVRALGGNPAAVPGYRGGRCRRSCGTASPLSAV